MFAKAPLPTSVVLEGVMHATAAVHHAYRRSSGVVACGARATADPDAADRRA